MKRLFAALFVLVAVCAAIEVQGTSCLGKNPFLAKLSNSNLFKVKIFESPQMRNQTKCTFEWNEHGSCCEVDSLVTYAKKDREFIRRKMAELKTGIVQIFQQLKSFTKELDQIRAINDKRLAPLHAVIEQLQSNNPHLNTRSLHASLEVLNLTNLTTCSDELSRVRGSALCSVCAGNSEHFFLAKKALVSTDACLRLYEKCEFQVSAPTIFLEALKKELDQINSEASIVLNPKLNEIIKPQNNNSYLQNQMEAMSQMLKSSHHTMKDKVDFCEKLIKLVEEPNFFKIIEEQKQVLGLMRSISSRFSRIKERQPATYSVTARNPKEVLQSGLHTSESNLTLSGDLIVAPVDPMDPRANIDSSYTSYFGANGTNSNEASLHKLLPINLTSIFP